MPAQVIWILIAFTVVALAFAWGLLAMLLHYGQRLARAARWRYRCWRYWRAHPLGPIQEWETQRRG